MGHPNQRRWRSIQRSLQLFFVSLWVVLILGMMSATMQPVSAQTTLNQGSLVAQAGLLEEITSNTEDKKTEEQEVPDKATQFPYGNQVVLGGQPLFSVETAAGALSREERAQQISESVQKFARDRSLPIDSLQVKRFSDEQSLEIRGGNSLLMSVYKADAKAVGEDHKTLADLYLKRIREGVIRYRNIYSPKSFAIAVGKAAIAALVLWMLTWLVNKVYRIVISWFTAEGNRLLTTIRIGSREIINADQIKQAFLWSVRLLRVFLFIIFGSVFLRIVLSFFPQTKNASKALFQPVITAVFQIIEGFVSYIPKLIFLILLGIVVFYTLKLIRLFFGEIDKGDLSIPGFDQDWAIPTARIAQILTLAMAAVVAFPYLPGAGSGAFQGISIFLGLLISLGSSSAISNIIAGILLTYTRAFKIGDEVEVSGVAGTIVEKGILVTRLLTFTNYFVSIPNSEILSSHVTNFRKGGSKSSQSYPPPIILMELGFGYDVSWQQATAILLEAANSCEWVLKTPPAFVTHQELSNYYCTYALRMYTNAPEKGIFIKSFVMQKVQEICIAHGITLELPDFNFVKLSQEVSKENFSLTNHQGQQAVDTAAH